MVGPSILRMDMGFLREIVSSCPISTLFVGSTSRGLAEILTVATSASFFGSIMREPTKETPGCRLHGLATRDQHQKPPIFKKSVFFQRPRRV